MLKRVEAVGLRTVALFEAMKGGLVLLLGFGVLALIHRDVDDMAERLVDFLHINPDGKLSDLFFRLADKATDKNLLTLAVVALIYSAIRFVEAYGLWHERAWAEWFALISGCVYLPFEVMGIIHHPHLLHWAILIINVLIILYMADLRVKAALRRKQLQERNVLPLEREEVRR